MCSSNKSKPEEILKYLGTIVVVVVPHVKND